MTKLFDIVLFGATGIAGVHCIPYLHKFSKENGRNLSWAVSGRSENKLKEALNTAGKKIGTDLSQTPIILADVADNDSLLRMTQQAKIVINCCGPFSLLGKPVLEACIAGGAHHLDISGEPEYIDSLQENYQKAAEEKGIFIISTCGMDCVPCDLGVIHLQKNFNGVLNSVVAHVQTWPEYRDDGPVIGYGTWATLVVSVNHFLRFKELKKKFFPPRILELNPKLKVCYLPHKSKALNVWSMIFIGHDKTVADKTQQLLYESESQRPVQVETLMSFSSFLSILKILYVLTVLTLLAPLKCTRQWLLNSPHLFSFGMVKKNQEPSPEVFENTVYQLTLYGKGWKDQLDKKDCQYSKPPNKKIMARITTKAPQYGFSCGSVVAAALTVLTERDKLPQKGGVYTPGFAFRNTSFMKLLMDNGLSFSILYEKDI